MASLDDVASDKTPSVLANDLPASTRVALPGPGALLSSRALHRYRDRIRLARIRDRKQWGLPEWWMWLKVKEFDFEENIAQSFRLRYQHRKLVIFATWLPRIIFTILLLWVAHRHRWHLKDPHGPHTPDDSAYLRATIILTAVCAVSLGLDLLEICLFINFRLLPYILLTTNILKLPIWTYNAMPLIKSAIKGFSGSGWNHIPQFVESAILFLPTLASFIYALHISYQRFRDRKTGEYSRNGAKHVNWIVLRAQLQRQIDPEWVDRVPEPPIPDSDQTFNPDSDDLDAPGNDNDIFVTVNNFENNDEIVYSDQTSSPGSSDLDAPSNDSDVFVTTINLDNSDEIV
ncbi:hypothetical protein MBLNU457_1878t1 [Dothideomycetes sp. NU457]